MLPPLPPHAAYIDLTRKNRSRKALVKLTISSHKVRIETVRYDNVSRDDSSVLRLEFLLIEDPQQFFLKKEFAHGARKNKFMTCLIELKCYIQSRNFLLLMTSQNGFLQMGNNCKF